MKKMKDKMLLKKRLMMKRTSFLIHEIFSHRALLKVVDLTSINQKSILIMMNSVAMARLMVLMTA